MRATRLREVSADALSNLLASMPIRTKTFGMETITATKSMKELLGAYPGAQRALFRKYHIGGCASCGFSPEETLEQVCARNGVNFEEALAWISECDAQDRANEILPQELADHKAAGNPVRMLDIRTREEWDAVRIPGAEFFTQDFLQEILCKWPKGELIVVYDHTGKRSLDATTYLLGQGFTNVKSLRGGIDAWAEIIEPGMMRYDVA